MCLKLTCARAVYSFKKRGVHEWESIVAANRPSFTTEFFEHAENLVKAVHDKEQEQEGASSKSPL